MGGLDLTATTCDGGEGLWARICRPDQDLPLGLLAAVSPVPRTMAVKLYFYFYVDVVGHIISYFMTFSFSSGNGVFFPPSYDAKVKSEKSPMKLAKQNNLLICMWVFVYQSILISFAQFLMM